MTEMDKLTKLSRAVLLLELRKAGYITTSLAEIIASVEGCEPTPEAMDLEAEALVARFMTEQPRLVQYDADEADWN